MNASCRVAGVCVLLGVLGACQTPPKTPEDAVRAANQQDTEEVRYRSVRNLADAIVVFEQQFRIRYGADEVPPLQILADARYVLGLLKVGN